jgi:hypothetical protein
MRLSLAVLVVASSGCTSMFAGPSMPEVAARTYAASHGGAHADVTVRADLGHDGMTVYEVHDGTQRALFPCFPYHIYLTGAYDDGAAVSSIAPAECLTSDWCDAHGCDTVELSARHAFATTNSCPLDRVIAAPRAAILPAPPAEIAADPERAALWYRAHQDEVTSARDGTWQTATGCGSTTIYRCTPIDLRDRGVAYAETPTCTAVTPA